MKKIIDKFLIKRSIRPYKVVPLSTGVIVEHYRNGKLKTEYYEQISRNNRNIYQWEHNHC